MLFTAINDKSYRELTFQELHDFFVDRAFFKFMDQGRTGFQTVAYEIVVNHGNWLFAQNPKTYRDSIDRERMGDLTSQIEKLLINGFIREGTAGLRDAILSAHNVITNAHRLRGDKLQAAHDRDELKQWTDELKRNG